LLLDALVGIGQFSLGLVGRRQAVGHLLGALVERGHDRRPDELHREPDQDQEHDHLDDQGAGDVHGSSLNRSDEVRRPARQGRPHRARR